MICVVSAGHLLYNLSANSARTTFRRRRATSQMSRAVRIISIVFIILFFAIVSVSGAAQIFKRGIKVTDGKAAYVQEAASLKDYVLYSAFGVSGNEKVIAGDEGWLFFAETLDDYTGARLLSDEEIENIARKLKSLNDHCAKNGAELCFIIAPNKNTIYPEFMPNYYKNSDNSNFSRLLDSLEAQGVKAPDARELLLKHKHNEDTLYYKTDTHWNAKGAAIIADYLIDSFAPENSFRYADSLVDPREFTGGDLYKLLFPSASIRVNGVSGISDITYHYAETSGFVYTEPPISMMDLDIETRCESAKGGKLLVYRDSFGSELVPLLSSQFETVHYLRGNMPYDFSCIEAEHPDRVVFIIAERNIPSLLTAAFEFGRSS